MSSRQSRSNGGRSQKHVKRSLENEFRRDDGDVVEVIEIDEDDEGAPPSATRSRTSSDASRSGGRDGGMRDKKRNDDSPSSSSSSKKRKRRVGGIESFMSPAKSSRKNPPPTSPAKTTTMTTPTTKVDDASSSVAAIVTPADDVGASTKRTTTTQTDEYVPRYIHKNLSYRRRGESDHLSDVQLECFRRILDHYLIPEDLERNRTRYGPLSGSTYEELVIEQYGLGRLRARDATEPGRRVMICTACAATGHKRTTCPTLI